MHPAPSPATEPGAALAAAIAGILRAMLMAVFGDIAAMPEGSLRRRLLAKFLADVAALESALGAAFALPVPEQKPSVARRPSHARRAAPRVTTRAGQTARPRRDPAPSVASRRPAPRASAYPPCERPKPLIPRDRAPGAKKIPSRHPHTHAHFIPIS